MSIIIFDDHSLLPPSLSDFPEDCKFFYVGPSSFLYAPNVVSIYNCIEDNHDFYKFQLDSFIQSLYTQLDISSNLFVFNDVPLISLSFLNQRDYFSSPYTYSHFLSLFALDHEIGQINYSSIHIFVKDKKLKRSIVVHFNHRDLSHPSYIFKIISYQCYLLTLSYCKSLFFLLLSLRFHISRFILKLFIAKPSLSKSISEVDTVFVSPFCNFNKSNASMGIFDSTLWLPLLTSLTETNKTFNILHFFVDNPSFNSPYTVSNIINGFCKSLSPKIHYFAFWFLKYGDIRDSFVTYCRIWFRVVFNIHYLIPKIINDRKFAFYLFYVETDLTSILSSNLYSTFSYYRIFKSYFSSYINVKRCVFTSENQLWERALVSALKSTFPVADAFAFCHTTIRKWDLRYFNTSVYSSRYGTSSPDLCLVTSESYIRDLSVALISDSTVRVVEAIRLFDLYTPSISAKSSNKNTSIVTIFGDYNPSTTVSMLNLFDKLPSDVLNQLSINLKQHPVYYREDICPSYICDVTFTSIEDILATSQFLVFSPTTSTSLLALFHPDIYCIYYSDPLTLDSSPLSQYSVPSFSTTFQLSSLIYSYFSSNLSSTAYQSYPSSPFLLDKKLPNWLNLLS